MTDPLPSPAKIRPLVGLMIEPPCRWKLVPENEYWQTDCDNAHCFIDGGPKENKYQFCPYCGRTLKVKRGR